MVFQSGKSGNPSGRPKGVQDKRSSFKAMIQPSCDQLLKKAVDMALEGNEAMLKLLLDRILPAKLREDPMPIDIKSGSLVEQSKLVLAELSKGSITASTSKDLMHTIALQARIIESDELEKRLAQIEQVHRIGFSDSDFVQCDET